MTDGLDNSTVNDEVVASEAVVTNDEIVVVSAHVLTWRQREPGGEVLNHVRARQVFRGQTDVGGTDQIRVFTDGTPTGDAAAQAVLKTAGDDYNAVAAWFGGLTLPAGQDGDDQNTPRTAMPIRVLVDQQAGGAYHFGCDATDLYIEPTAEVASGFMVAELVEVFESAIGNGWQCGNTNGEGLSRVLAWERNNGLGPMLSQTYVDWWANGHNDYVNQNTADDRDEFSNGCATLFLFYLRYTLGYDWTKIVTTGGVTLGETYQKLTGKSGVDGFNEMVAALQPMVQNGALSVPASGNPFANATTTPPTTDPTPPAPTPDPTPPVSTPPVPTPPTPAPTQPDAPVAVASGAGWVLPAMIVLVILIVVVALALVGVLFSNGTL